MRKVLGIIVFVISTPFIAVGLIGMWLFIQADYIGAFGIRKKR